MSRESDIIRSGVVGKQRHNSLELRGSRRDSNTLTYSKGKEGHGATLFGDSETRRGKARRGDGVTN